MNVILCMNKKTVALIYITNNHKWLPLSIGYSWSEFILKSVLLVLELSSFFINKRIQRTYTLHLIQETVTALYTAFTATRTFQNFCEGCTSIACLLDCLLKWTREKTGTCIKSHLPVPVWTSSTDSFSLLAF